jgi:hypothetical protein
MFGETDTLAATRVRGYRSSFYPLSGTLSKSRLLVDRFMRIRAPRPPDRCPAGCHAAV